MHGNAIRVSYWTDGTGANRGIYQLDDVSAIVAYMELRLYRQLMGVNTSGSGGTYYTHLDVPASYNASHTASLITTQAGSPPASITVTIAIAATASPVTVTCEASTETFAFDIADVTTLGIYHTGGGTPGYPVIHTYHCNWNTNTSGPTLDMADLVNGSVALPANVSGYIIGYDQSSNVIESYDVSNALLTGFSYTP